LVNEPAGKRVGIGTKFIGKTGSAVAEGPRDDPSHSVPPLRVTSKDFDNLAAR